MVDYVLNCVSYLICCLLAFCILLLLFDGFICVELHIRTGIYFSFVLLSELLCTNT